MKEQGWGEYKIQEKEPTSIRLGPLQIWCKISNNEFWLASQYDEIESSAPKPASLIPPEDLSWTRRTLKDKHFKVRLTPLFPDRPVVIKPEYSFQLMLNTSARIFVRCPLWIKIELIGETDLAITEIPTAILSNTWFGNFTAGDLCYWISSAARREITLDLSRPYLAICPIQITNGSEEILSIEKICLRVGGLSLYRCSAGQLWSDETQITYRGSHSVSQIKVSGKHPPECPGATPIAKPRNPETRTFARKTFSFLKDLPGLGFLSE